MNVLVTGCKGQLGNELYKIITEKKSELGEIPQCFHDCKLTCIDVENLDITDLEAVQAYTRTLRPEVVINCAAYTNVNGCESDRDAAFRVNALGPRNLAVACGEGSQRPGGHSHERGGPGPSPFEAGGHLRVWRLPLHRKRSGVQLV